MTLRHDRISRKLLIALLPAALLAGCVSFGAEAPPALLVLTADQNVAEGTVNSGAREDALVILTPDVPRKLNVTRVPVQINASSIAYLADAVWADKPARLWKGLLEEVVAARKGRFILSDTAAAGKAQLQLAGTLHEFGVDSQNSEVVIVYDAVTFSGGKQIRKRRFEVREDILLVEVGEAAPALNNAANRLAREVADWLDSTPPAEKESNEAAEEEAEDGAAEAEES